MAETAEVIRRDIERTRLEMGETLDALEYKANVPARTKGWMGRKKDAVTGGCGAAFSGVSRATDSMISRVSGAAPGTAEIRDGATSVKDTAERNPLGLALAGAAVGFVAGLLAPPTRFEDEKVGTDRRPGQVPGGRRRRRSARTRQTGRAGSGRDRRRDRQGRRKAARRGTGLLDPGQGARGDTGPALTREDGAGAPSAAPAPPVETNDDAKDRHPAGPGPATRARRAEARDGRALVISRRATGSRSRCAPARRCSTTT